jgi:hypothetical protein
VDGRQSEGVDQYRALEIERLDALQVGLWDPAIDGDGKAALAVVRIIEQCSRLLGLDRVDSTPSGSGSVVIRSMGIWGGFRETQEAGQHESSDSGVGNCEYFLTRPNW